MKRRVNSTRKFALAWVACAMMLASVNSAKAYRFPLPPINVEIGDQHELGEVSPGISAGHNNIDQYINFMVGLSLGGSGHLIINGQDNLVTRSSNDFGSLFNSETLALTGGSMTINLGTPGTYDYLLANYNAPNGASEVWYIGDLSGTIVIEGNLGEYGLSSWALFSPTPQNVPDGGATVMLLGLGVGSLSLMRRYLLRS
jgi:hypothetical protein